VIRSNHCATSVHLTGHLYCGFLPWADLLYWATHPLWPKCLLQPKALFILLETFSLHIMHINYSSSIRRCIPDILWSVVIVWKL